MSFVAAVAFWLPHTLGAGVIAMWLFAISAAAVALVLPLPYALVSPLFMGVAGWLVDMLPFVILVGSVAVVARWVVTLLLERRLPRGARTVWLPVFLVVWTALGVVVISSTDIKHFLLLFGLQVLSSGYILAVIDSLGRMQERLRLIAALLLYVVLLSVGVLLQWFGVPIQPLQNNEVSARVETAYGLDAFTNHVGMIKYTLSTKAGTKQFKQRLDAFAKSHPSIPSYRVIAPRGHAWSSFILIRFDGSARPEQAQLAQVGVQLAYDNVGLAPSIEVPRLRSFARNPLTYGGVCVVLLPFAFFFVWTGGRRRRWLGLVGIAASLFGAAFSLSRGAWIAIVIGIIYLAIDGALPWRRKLQVLLAFVGIAVVITAVFTIKYGIDPLHARAGGEGSINTRRSLYKQTAGAVGGIHLLIGYGTELPRTATGVSHLRGRYIPQAGTHSTYLNYLFRAGFPGMLALMALYAVAGLHARAISRVRSGDERLLGSLTAMSVVAFAAHGVILSLFVEPIYTLVVSLVVGLALVWALDLNASVWPWRTRNAHP
ncbi:MAG: polysaccharide biosynthesis protein PslJ [Actinomycetota bacterium]|nr:polysaccharide biosynthesis protein PslJ [Actinomycetota bacterium]